MVRLAISITGGALFETSDFGGEPTKSDQILEHSVSDSFRHIFLICTATCRDPVDNYYLFVSPLIWQQ